jgi:lactate dehydrogenase-like 2-hydroxyacid dehydrogenase
MKQGKWEKKKFLGEEVREKTLGLAGLGRIGQEVARRAAAFDMRIIAHDPFISEEVAGDLGVELVSLDDLFARSDYVSLHMPSNATTKNIVNADRLPARRKASVSSTRRAEISSMKTRWPTRSRRARSEARRSMCFRKSRPSISGYRCCHRS